MNADSGESREGRRNPLPHRRRELSGYTRSARTTRYARFLPEVHIEFFEGRHSSGFDVGQASLDSFEGLHLVYVVEQFLVGRGILNDDLRLAVDGEDHGIASFAHLFQELAAVSLEIAQGADAGTDV